ncbi:MAG TPA: energy transducer TonB [Pyrinomonadaceae bacterium]|jgi:TonB family protein
MTGEEQTLKLLLASWDAPDSSAHLGRRVADSFRQMMRRKEEGAVMKRCPMCHEEFAPQFRFCPVDGLPLVPAEQQDDTILFGDRRAETERAPAFALAGDANTLPGARAAVPSNGVVRRVARAGGEYHLTMLPETGLVTRLTAEVRAVARESQLTWPELRRDPAGFARRTAVAYGLLLRRQFAREHFAFGVACALALMLTFGGALVALDRYHKTHDPAADKVRDDLVYLGPVTDIPLPARDEEGAAGRGARGAGGGSAPEKTPAHGGGGGGRHEQTPASVGKLPPATWEPPLLAPNPKPPAIQNPHLPTAVTLQGDPVLFPPDPSPRPYGDPKAQAQELSSGPGDGNGIGDGTGGGVGSGRGDGYGPGEGGNTGGGPMTRGGNDTGCCGGTRNYANAVFTTRDVTKKAVITAKPEPTFTEEARKNGVTGEVVLRMVLASNGAVTNIVPVKRLPDGLTERAIEAARRIRFVPAEKDGHQVSQYVSVVYNFNIY